jgi:hypothetical protein
LLTISILVESLNALTIRLVKIITVVTRSAKSIGGIESGTLSVDCLTRVAIEPVTTKTLLTASTIDYLTISYTTIADTCTTVSQDIALYTADTVACLISRLTELLQWFAVSVNYSEALSADGTTV